MMKVPDQPIHCLTREKVAIDQLDWAIRLFLDHRAFVPAITLAGAAEECLGKPLGQAASMFQLQRHLQAAGLGVDLNQVRNFLKHGNGETLDVDDIETVALTMILRAGGNLFEADQSIVSEMPRLLDWIRASRSDLLLDAALATAPARELKPPLRRAPG